MVTMTDNDGRRISDMTYEEKKQKLQEQMPVYAQGDMLVAFSGGVDSSLILKLAVQAAAKTGHQVYGIMMHTMLHPMGEVEDARVTAEQIGAEFRVLEIDELKGADILDNPVDRCYRCKKYLFRNLIEEGEKLGVSVMMEGTNEDDLHVYRPGLRAIRELGIHSPLAEAGMTKAEVRRLAGELGVSVSNKPSMPCLATRFPYGTRISYEAMRKVDEGEAFIRSLGFYNVRLRIHNDVARIEVDVNEMPHLLEHCEQIVAKLKNLGYDYITVDLEGFRSGSMDLHVKK